MNLLLTIITLLLYAGAGALLLARLARAGAGKKGKALPLLMGYSALLLHAVLLSSHLFVDGELNLNLVNALSLTAWFISLLLLVSILGQPLENLGIAILPLTGLMSLLPGVVDETPVIIGGDTGMRLHILLSILSFSLLSIAALQAILLAVQDRHLRNRQPGGFIRSLPPLETMESLLFRIIGLGYVLLSLALVTGVPYLQNIVEQQLIHKTVLSVAAWLVFLILIWGRWRFGWRGRTAIRWTLGGLTALILAYFGSKLVVEVILA